MKTILLVSITMAGLALAACSSLSTSTVPTTTQTQQIQNACAVDAGVRPSVTILLPLATPAEQSGIKAVETTIDAVCANPSQPLQADAITAFTAALAQLAQYELTLQSRKAGVSLEQYRAGVTR